MCEKAPPHTHTPHPSQKGFAKYSWNCSASGLSRKQYIASTRLCSADEGSVALPSQPETKMIRFSHAVFFRSLAPSPASIQASFLSHFLGSLPSSFLFPFLIPFFRYPLSLSLLLSPSLFAFSPFPSLSFFFFVNPK